MKIERKQNFEAESLQLFLKKLRNAIVFQSTQNSQTWKGYFLLWKLKFFGHFYFFIPTRNLSPEKNLNQFRKIKYFIGFFPRNSKAGPFVWTEQFVFGFFVWDKYWRRFRSQKEFPRRKSHCKKEPNINICSRMNAAIKPEGIKIWRTQMEWMKHIFFSSKAAYFLPITLKNFAVEFFQ